MKRLILLLAVLFSTYALQAQTSYYKGEWTCAGKTDRFSGIFQVRIKADGRVTGKLVWVYHAVDSNDAEMVAMYKGKRGKVGMEYVSGTFNPATNDIYFEGTKKNDPQQIIGTDKYTLKLSADRRTIYGKTDSNGNNDGLFYGRRMSYKNGAQQFATLQKKIR